MKPPKWAMLTGMVLLASQACYANASVKRHTETESAANLLHLQVFTHRDTFFAQFPEEKAAKGIVPDLIGCAADAMGFTYEFVIAPLSRSQNIIAEKKHALWFPARHRGDKERMKRLIGPIGQLKSYWYQLKSNLLDPRSEEFKVRSQVTAYSKSSFENELREQGYNWVEGSADYKRLIYMLMSGQVDALSAADFHLSVDPDTWGVFEKRTRRTAVESVPISLQVSRYMRINEPQFVERLNNRIHACKKE